MIGANARSIQRKMGSDDDLSVARTASPASLQRSNNIVSAEPPTVPRPPAQELTTGDSFYSRQSSENDYLNGFNFNRRGDHENLDVQRRKTLLEQQTIEEFHPDQVQVPIPGSVSHTKLNHEETVMEVIHEKKGFTNLEYFAFLFLILLPLLPAITMISLAAIFIRLLQPAADSTLGYCRSRKFLYYPFFAIFTTVLYVGGMADAVADVAVLIVMFNDVRGLNTLPTVQDPISVYDVVRLLVVIQCIILGMIAAASIVRNEQESFILTAFSSVIQGGKRGYALFGMTWRIWLFPVRLHMTFFSWMGRKVQKKNENRIIIWCYNALMLTDTMIVSIPIGIFSLIDLFRALRSSGFVLVPERHIWLLMKVITGILCAFNSAYFASKSAEINRPLSSF